MKTLQKQISLFTEEQSTSSPEDSHASHTAQQESDLERKITATSGRTCLERYGRFNRAGSWGKTYAALLIGMTGWYSTKCKLIWSLRATKCSRFYFQLAPSTLPIEETGYGLLPTTQSMGMLPTPQAIDGNGQGRKLRLKKDCKRDPNQPGSWSGDLKDYAVTGMLPTPAARDYKGARTAEALQESGRNHTNSLPDTYAQTGKSSQLNPRFVAEMMGFPPSWTELPFQSGEQNLSKATATP